MVRLSSMFRHTAAPLGAALIALMSAAPVHAASPEERAVLAPFQSILDAIAKRDRNLMRDNLLPGGMVTLKRGDKITQLHFDGRPQI